MPGSSAAVVFSQQCPVELKQALSNSSAVFEALSIVKTLSVVSNRCCVTLCCLQSSAKELQSCVKTYNKYHLDDEELQQVVLEVQLHQQLASGRVVPFWAAIDEGRQLHIIMQYCQQSDLRSMLNSSSGPLSEATVRDKVVIPLLEALQELHAKGYVHRDLKPENTFLAGGSALLGDFSLAVGPLLAAGCTTSAHPISAPCSPPAAHHHHHHGPFSGGCGDGCSCDSNSGGCHTPSSSSLSLSDLDHPSGGGADSETSELLGSAASLTINSCSAGDGAVGSSSFSRTSSLSAAATTPTERCSSLHAGGTPAYCAPEVVLAAFNSLPMSAALRPQNDIWSLGVLAAECLMGQHPFGDAAATAGGGGGGGGAVMHSIISSQPLPLSQLNVSSHCKDWLAAALAKDPRQRWSAERLLQHPWVAAGRSAAGAGLKQQQHTQEQVDEEQEQPGSAADAWDKSCWAAPDKQHKRQRQHAPSCSVPPWVEDDWVTGLSRLSSLQQTATGGDSCSSRDVMQQVKHHMGGQQQAQHQCHLHGITSWED